MGGDGERRALAAELRGLRGGKGLTIDDLAKRVGLMNCAMVNRLVPDRADTDGRARALYGAIFTLVRNGAKSKTSDVETRNEYRAMAYDFNLKFFRQWDGKVMRLIEDSSAELRDKVATGETRHGRIRPIEYFKGQSSTTPMKRAWKAVDLVIDDLCDPFLEPPSELLNWASGVAGQRGRLQHTNLPPTLTSDDFIGRESQLEALVEHVRQCTTVVVSGPGGIGKSQLVAQAIATVEGDISRIAKLDCSSSLADGQLASFGRSIGAVSDKSLSVAEQVIETRDYLATTNEQWLLVLDNVPDFATLERLTPTRKPSGSIVVTTIPSLAVPGSEVLELGVLERHSSVELLCRLSGRSDDGSADELASELSDIPLALVQAGVYCRNKTENGDGGVDFGEYLNRLRSMPLIDLSKSGGLYPNYDRSLYLSWILSLVAAANESDLLKAILAYGPLAFMDGQGVDDDILLPWPADQEAEFRHVMWALERYRLLERSGGTIRVHSVFQRLCREQLEIQLTDTGDPFYTHCAVHALHCLCARSMQKEDTTNTELNIVIGRVAPHVLAWISSFDIVRIPEDLREDLTRLLEEVMVHVTRNRLAVNPVATCRPLVDAVSRLWGQRSIQAGMFRLILVNETMAERHPNALRDAKEAYDIIGEVCEEIAYYIQARMAYATILWYFEHRDEAVDLFEGVLRMQTPQAAAVRRQVLTRLTQFEWIQGNTSKAISYAEMAKDLPKQSNDSSEIVFETFLTGYPTLEHVEMARQLYEERRSNLGRSNRYTLDVLHLYAAMSEFCGDPEPWNLVVTEYTEAYGEDHPEVLKVRANQNRRFWSD